MKLDKRHMIASLVVLALSIVYNVWVFMGSGTAARPGAARVQPLDADTAEVPQAGAIDPAQLPGVPSVELARAPNWTTTPFAHVRPQAPLEAPVASNQPVAETEPDVVVAAILHAADRRVAMINGRIVRPGDKIGTVTIVDILPNGVIVESPMRGRRTLELGLPQTALKP